MGVKSPISPFFFSIIVMEYQDPYPDRVSGLQKARPDGHVKIFGKTHEDMIATATHIGFFTKDKLPLNVMKLQLSKIVVLPHAPKRCRKCGEYMQLKRGSSMSYTCVSKCLDRKAIRYIKQQKMKRFQQKPIESKSVVGVRLDADWLHA